MLISNPEDESSSFNAEAMELNKRLRKKSVDFRPAAQFRKIPHLNDFGPEIITLCYFQDSDYKRMAAENDQVTKLASDGRKFDDETITTRGLEPRLNPREGRRLKKNSVRAVLKKQHHLWSTPVKRPEESRQHPDLIARAYNEFSAKALHVARTIAIQDEEDAKQLVNSSTKVRRSVQFATQAKMRTTIHINDFSDEELRDTYYEYLEFKTFKIENKQTVKMFIKGSALEDNDQHSCRGLEYMIPRNAKVRKQVRALTINAVLDEQDRQDCDRECNPDLIAKEYSEIAKACVSTAQKFALADERFATVYSAKDRNRWELFQKSRAAVSSST